MNASRFATMLGSACVVGLLCGPAAAQVAAPHRKAGWWQMSSQLQGGRSFTRNLCLDANFDARHNILQPAPGCTMTLQAIAGGYGYKKVCGGESTTGTAVGDFDSAYKINESRGAMRVTTDARWMGACPAGHAAGEMW